MVNEFDRLAVYVCDSDGSYAEKHLSKLKDSDLAGLKNVLGQNLLFIAVGADKVKIIEYLLRRGLSLTDIDDYGRTLLHWAVKFSSFSCIKFLLSNNNTKAKILAPDKSKVTPLHLAAENKSAKVFRILLSHLPADTNLHEVVDCHKRSILHYAAQNGSFEVCQIIVSEEMMPIDPRDELNQTPLMYAASSNFATNVFKILSQKKPSSIGHLNKAGLTAFHLAVTANNLVAIEFLCDDLSYKNHLATFCDSKKRNLLHHAAAMGRTEAAKMLIHYGARNESCDKFGATPAHYAAQTCKETLEAIMDCTNSGDVTDQKGRSCFMWAVLAENEGIVRWMLDNKSLSIDRRAKDIYYCTALHLAAQIGSLNICKLLIKQGWSLTDRDINEATPSHLAAGAGHTELIRYFQTALADKNEVDAADRTPLFYACAAGQTSTVQIMICDLKFPITVVDRHGQTPLHYAAYSGIAACLRVLLQRPECNVNAFDENGKTALHIACRRGKVDIIKLLVEAGADPNISSMKSETPLALAMAEGNTKIIDALTVSNENL